MILPEKSGGPAAHEDQDVARPPTGRRLLSVTISGRSSWSMTCRRSASGLGQHGIVVIDPPSRSCGSHQARSSPPGRAATTGQRSTRPGRSAKKRLVLQIPRRPCVGRSGPQTVSTRSRIGRAERKRNRAGRPPATAGPRPSAGRRNDRASGRSLPDRRPGRNRSTVFLSPTTKIVPVHVRPRALAGPRNSSASRFDDVPLRGAGVPAPRPRGCDRCRRRAGTTPICAISGARKQLPRAPDSGRSKSSQPAFGLGGRHRGGQEGRWRRHGARGWVFAARFRRPVAQGARFPRGGKRNPPAASDIRHPWPPVRPCCRGSASSVR